MRFLALPEEVLRQGNRQEVFRAWIDRGMLSISLCNAFPDSYSDDTIQVWGILISDVFHHVVDAIVLQTGGSRLDVQRALRSALSEVSQSGRGARRGTLKTVSDRLSEIPAPDVSDDANCVEIARIVLVPDSIRVMVLVGMWLPDDEESVWGNLLYDFSTLVAETLVSELDSATLQAELLDEVFDRIDDPGTELSGEYYDNEQANGGNGSEPDA